MSEPTEAEITRARDLGVSMYLSAYVHLMARNLGIDDSDNVAMNGMAALLIEPVNLATEAAFRALVNDRQGSNEALDRLRECLSTLP